jgi:hypothetical protein
MTKDERLLLEELDRILRSDEVRARIHPVVERVRKDLTRKKQAVMAWEPIPLAIYASALPPTIQSSWVFILRAGANTGAERHPNSHQRMMTLEGSGDMQTEKQKKWQQLTKQTSNAQRPTSNAEIKEGKADPSEPWQSNVLVSDPDAPLERRWISIPQNVWHQPVVPDAADWVVVSFHTVPAEELIEERPDSGQGRPKQMKYVGTQRG